jgi:hypothetical protein
VGWAVIAWRYRQFKGMPDFSSGEITRYAKTNVQPLLPENQGYRNGKNTGARDGLCYLMCNFSMLNHYLPVLFLAERGVSEKRRVQQKKSLVKIPINCSHVL